MADLNSEIETNAQGPKQVVVDGIVVQAHSLQDQIEADRYLKQQAAGNKKTLPIRFAKFQPGGAAP